MTSPTPVIRIGTRRSPLALAQTGHVAAALHRATGAAVELVEVVTRGDRDRASLAAIGGTGVFAAELRERLLAGDVDLAVHSLKDLPTAPLPGLTVAAVPPREDPRDVLVTPVAGRLDAGSVATGAQAELSLAALPGAARVGTGSPRRAAQLLAVRPDLRIVDVRGNVGTRIAMVDDGTLDAVVLARAGLLRLGLDARAAAALPFDVMLPAPGQGALAVEARAGSAAAALAAALDHRATRAAVTAERAFLAALEAGCTAPVGALAAPAGSPARPTAGPAADVTHLSSRRAAAGTERPDPASRGSRPDPVDGAAGPDDLILRVAVGLADPSRVVRMSDTGPAVAAEDLGRRLAAQVLAAMADRPVVEKVL